MRQRLAHEGVVEVQLGGDEFLTLAVDRLPLGEDPLPQKLHHLRLDVLRREHLARDEAPERPAHVALGRHEAAVQLLDVGVDRLDDLLVDVGRLRHLQRVVVARRGDEVGADRAGDAADHHRLAEPVAQGRHQPDEVLVAGEQEEGLDVGPGQGGVDHVDHEVEVGPRLDLLPPLRVGGALGREVERLEAGDVEPGAHRRRVLVEVGVGPGDRHQAVPQRLVPPRHRVGLAPEGVDRRVADVLEVDERRHLAARLLRRQPRRSESRTRSSVVHHHHASGPRWRRPAARGERIGNATAKQHAARQRRSDAPRCSTTYGADTITRRVPFPDHHQNGRSSTRGRRRV